MQLAFYVHPFHYVRSSQFPDYRRGKVSREAEKAWVRIQEGEVRYTAQQMLEQAVAVMKSQDMLLLRGIREEEVLAAKIQPVLPLTLCPIPEARTLPPDHYFTILTDDNGEILVWAHVIMGSKSDDTYNFRDDRFR